jgi:hypothetical protein
LDVVIRVDRKTSLIRTQVFGEKLCLIFKLIMMFNYILTNCNFIIDIASAFIKVLDKDTDKITSKLSNEKRVCHKNMCGDQVLSDNIQNK